MILLHTSFCDASSRISETLKLAAEKHSTNIPYTNKRLKETRSTTTQRRRQSIRRKPCVLEEAQSGDPSNTEPVRA
jgi:hypothetical protein